ncbi:MAG: MGMT family protein [Butyricicoccus pullicaecorum]|nr:MGMT family protein [Butyricicoccus pullicaecorum]
MNSYERIYAIVRAIPSGCVATYGQVARLAGNPRWARVVGYALHVNPDPEGIPCYRVVDRMGHTAAAFAFGGADMQRALLEAEGVEFLPDGRVDLTLYQWDGILKDEKKNIL